ncbi:MAG: glycosyltransferase family 4 protein [Oscillospiraceae bacterium]|nr:glycosyltransferase family 4 protein [Oscillospiraceae bacterium]
MIKIAYVVDSTIPSRQANSVHAVKQARAFSKLAETILICREASEETVSGKILKEYGVEKSFRILPANVRASGRSKILLSGMKAAQLVKKERNVDFLYGRSVLSLYFARNAAPFMFEAHDWPEGKLLRFFLKRMLESKNCRGLVTISGELKKQFLREFPFLRDENVHVLHDGADIPAFTPEKLPIDNTQNADPEVVIGYLGHLYPGKCMEIIMAVAKKRPQYVFHIAGGTDKLVAYWNRELEKQNIRNVKLYGYIENKAVGEWYNTFHIFLLPIQKHIILGNGKRDIGKWISPLKLFEAMSYGKAILASDLPTIREVIVDGVNGLLADPDDAEDWARRIDELVCDKAKREALGAKARETLESKYTWDKRAAQILGFLENAAPQ